MNIHLHIDRLIVDGTPMTAHEARALQHGVEVELASLLASAPPQIANGYAVPALAAAPVAWDGHRTTNTNGASIARSLHAALTPPVLPDRGAR
jgi:hypothetical protein